MLVVFLQFLSVSVSLLDRLGGEDSSGQQPQGYDGSFPQQQQQKQRDYDKLLGGYPSQGYNNPYCFRSW